MLEFAVAVDWLTHTMAVVSRPRKSYLLMRMDSFRWVNATRGRSARQNIMRVRTIPAGVVIDHSPVLRPTVNLIIKEMHVK